MGNHEWCERCHMSDFHYGKPCEEVNPEGFKKAQKERDEHYIERKRGRVLLNKLAEKLKQHGIRTFIDSGYSADHITIAGYELVRAEDRKNADRMSKMQK